MIPNTIPGVVIRSKNPNFEEKWEPTLENLEALDDDIFLERDQWPDRRFLTHPVVGWDNNANALIPRTYRSRPQDKPEHQAVLVKAADLIEPELNWPCSYDGAYVQNVFGGEGTTDLLLSNPEKDRKSVSIGANFWAQMSDGTIRPMFLDIGRGGLVPMTGAEFRKLAKSKLEAAGCLLNRDDG